MSKNIQLIFCVETTKKSKTDYMYIQSVIDHYYNLKKNKITYLYMGTKDKYRSRKILSEISKYKKLFNVSRKRKSYVIYFIDQDNITSSQNDLQYYLNINSFCRENEFNLVWFIKDVENVMYGNTVEDHEKVSKSLNFYKQNLITQVNINNLLGNQEIKRIGMSNIMTVLDQFLERSE